MSFCKCGIYGFRTAQRKIETIQRNPCQWRHAVVFSYCLTNVGIQKNIRDRLKIGLLGLIFFWKYIFLCYWFCGLYQKN